MPVIFFRPQTLESIARKALSEYDTAYLGRPPGPVPIEIIIEKVYGLSIEYKYLTNNGRELGRMIYDDGITTYFDKDINDYALMFVRGGTITLLIWLQRKEEQWHSQILKKKKSQPSI